jgi:exonuclease III
MIVGDMNTPLPTNEHLQRLWQRRYPFNTHSYILYDFLRNNIMAVSDFSFDQKVNYTYSNGNSRSYIDHVFVSHYLMDSMKQCNIMSDLECNTSDNFPMFINVELVVVLTDQSTDSPDSVPLYPRLD